MRYSWAVHSLASALAASALVASAPAWAGDVHVEGRVGANVAGGAAKLAYGAAVGYDAALGALGNGVVAGVEQTADKAPSAKDVRWGTVGRVGVKLLGLGMLYGSAGYHYGAGPNAPSLGVGFQRPLGPVYGRVDYRHYFTEGAGPKTDAVVVGFGVSF